MGTCIWPKNLSKRLIKELVQGRDTTTQLQILLNKPFGEHGSVSVEELAGKILNSFTEAISVAMGFNDSAIIINNNNINNSNSDQFSGAGGDQGSQVNPEATSHCDDRSSEDSGESKKRSSLALKDRRGCYKRRKNSQSRIKISDTLEDGQAWRKYGQKEILNAQYPRAYFRCTRKYDQGCRATRQVQQIQDNPILYQTTYIGEHTCKNNLKAPQMIKDSDTWECPKFMVSSDIHNARVPNTSKSAAHMFKEHGEVKKETPKSDSLSENLSKDTENFWPDELKDLELSDPSMGLLSQKMGSNSDQDVVSMIMFSFEDQTCSTNTSQSLDMDHDLAVKSINFGKFEFDETEFPL